MPTLIIDTEDIEEAWVVCFGDTEGWHPSLAAGLFFSYKDAEAYVVQRQLAMPEPEWCILRVMPFEIKVVNDISDPENPPKGLRRG